MRTWYNKITGFFREVREEVMKCTRPSSAELKESTVVVVAAMAMLGVFILIADYIISFGLKVVFTG